MGGERVSLRVEELELALPEVWPVMVILAASVRNVSTSSSVSPERMSVWPLTNYVQRSLPMRIQVQSITIRPQENTIAKWANELISFSLSSDISSVGGRAFSLLPVGSVLTTNVLGMLKDSRPYVVLNGRSGRVNRRRM